MKTSRLAIAAVLTLLALIISQTAFAVPTPPEPQCVKISKDAGARANAAADAFRRAFGAEAANRGTDAGDGLWDATRMVAAYPTVYGLASIVAAECFAIFPRCPYWDSTTGTPTANAGPASDAQCKADWEIIQKGEKSVDDLSNDGHNWGLSANSHLDRVLSRKLSAPQKQSATALRDAIKSFAGTSDSCVNEVRSLVQQAARPKDIPGNAAKGAQAVGGAVVAGTKVAGNAAKGGSQIVSSTIVSGSKVAGDSIKTGSQAVGGAVSVVTTGAVDVAGKVVANQVGTKTREVVGSSRGVVDRAVTGGVSGSVDAGKKVIETGKGVIANVGAAAASAAATLTSFDGLLGSLFSVHLDSGTANVGSTEATLDGAITISLKSTPAARLTFNGHIVLKAGAAGTSSMLSGQTAATPQVTGGMQNMQGAVSAGAAASVTGASAGASIRTWASLEGRGSVTASLSTVNLPLTGNRELTYGNNTLYIGSGPLAFKGCSQETDDKLQMDNSGLTIGGKLTCGPLAIAESNIRISTAGQMSGGGKLKLFGHDFMMPYDLSGSRLKAGQRAEWPTTNWIGIPNVRAEYRVSGPAVDVSMDGPSGSMTLSTGGFEVQTTDKGPSGEPWVKMSFGMQSFATDPSGQVRFPQFTNWPSAIEDVEKKARDICKSAPDATYNKIPDPKPQWSTDAHNAAIALCDTDHPSPPAMPRLPNPFNVDLNALLSGAGRDMLSAVQSITLPSAGPPPVVNQVVGIIKTAGRQAATGAQQVGKVVGGASDRASGVVSDVITGGLGSSVSAALFGKCDALIAAVSVAPATQRKSAQAAAQKCVGDEGAKLGASSATDQLCVKNCGTDFYILKAEDNGRVAGRKAAQDNQNGDWVTPAISAGTYAGYTLFLQCEQAGAGAIRSNTSAKCYTGGGGSGLRVSSGGAAPTTGSTSGGPNSGTPQSNSNNQTNSNSTSQPTVDPYACPSGLEGWAVVANGGMGRIFRNCPNSTPVIGTPRCPQMTPGSYPALLVVARDTAGRELLGYCPPGNDPGGSIPDSFPEQ